MVTKTKPGYTYVESTATADFNGNDIVLDVPTNFVKFKNDGVGILQIVFNTEIEANPAIFDMKVLAGEEINLDGLQVKRISIKGSGAFRMWAYSRI